MSFLLPGQPPQGSVHQAGTPVIRRVSGPVGLAARGETALVHPVLTPHPRAVPRPRSAFYNAVGKRGLDIVLALAAIVLTAPVLLILMLALWIESGNPLFQQRRVGRNGRVFAMWKLRSMVPDAERKLSECLARNPDLRREWTLTQKLRHDPRITPLGHLIRKTSLDELPQLFNVLRGDMSLVGPRPMMPEQLEIYGGAQFYYALRPGITGLWQVTARNSSSFAARALFDEQYLRAVSLWTDIKIMLATVRVVLRATGC
jgi:exopolysaccharide production protein ExoY